MDITFKTPGEALFRTQLGKHGTSLFKSQTDLATAIINISSHYHDKKEDSVRSAVSHTITGKRKLSKELEEAMLAVIESRFDEQNRELLPKFKIILLEKFAELHEEINERKKYGSLGKTIQALLDRTHEATKVLVIASEAVEYYENELSNTIKDEMLRKVGVLPRPEYIAQAEYIFILPQTDSNVKESNAFLFWDKLIIHLEKAYDFDKDEAISKLKKINEDGWLKVFIINDDVAFLPFVLLDYHSFKISGYFSLYDKHHDYLNVAPMTQEFSQLWRTKFLSKILPHMKSKNEYGINKFY